MTFKIELSEQEIDDVVYNLRRMARYNRVEGRYRDENTCSLLAFRIENQERAQYQTNKP